MSLECEEEHMCNVMNHSYVVCLCVTDLENARCFVVVAIPSESATN